MYNVLEKLRAGEPLTDEDQKIHHAGLVSVLKQIHDDLDAAIFAAYGWPTETTDEQILERLVALNAERAAEEARGLIRYLRPNFQNPATKTRSVSEGRTQKTLEISDDAPKANAKKGRKRAAPVAAKPTKLPWPKEQAQRTKAIQDALTAAGAPVTVAELSSRFRRADKDQVEKILTALVALGHAHRLRGGKYFA